MQQADFRLDLRAFCLNWRCTPPADGHRAARHYRHSDGRYFDGSGAVGRGLLPNPRPVDVLLVAPVQAQSIAPTDAATGVVNVVAAGEAWVLGERLNSLRFKPVGMPLVPVAAIDTVMVQGVPITILTSFTYLDFRWIAGAAMYAVAAAVMPVILSV